MTHIGRSGARSGRLLLILAGRWRLLLVGLVALVMFLPSQASLPVTDRDEARFIQSSRQMVQTGDVIDIRFQDQPRHKKPVGIYWAQSLAALASGQGDEAPVAVWRLPSLIGAVAAVVLVAVAGRPLIGAGPAALAALLFAGSVVLGAEARIAKTDALLLALVMAMMAVLARLHMGSPPGPARDHRALTEKAPAGSAGVWIFWIALALSVLVKGPMGLMVSGLTALAVSVVRREARWLRPLARLWPILAALALTLPWFVAVTVLSEGGFWRASLGEDMLAKVGSGQEGKGVVPGAYLVALWITFWPGSVILALALAGIWRRRAEPAMVFLLCWVIPSWLVFEAVPTKLVHYTINLYPALALMAVHVWLTRETPGRTARAVASLLALAGPLLLGAALWYAVQVGTPLPLPGGLAALAGGALLIGALIALWRDQRLATPLLLTASAGVILAGLIATLARTPTLWPSERLMEAARAATGCREPAIMAWGYHEPSLVWLTGGTARLMAPDDPIPAGGGSCAAIIRPAATAMTSEEPPTEFHARVEAFAIGAGRSVRLDLFTYRQPQTQPQPQPQP